MLFAPRPARLWSALAGVARGQRGLAIIDLLARAWGHHRAAPWADLGTYVWADLSLAEGQAPRTPGRYAYADPPDLQIVLTAPPDVLRARINVRGSHGRFEDDPALPEREVELYRKAAAASGRSGVRTMVVDTSRGPESIESLLSELTNTIGGLWSQATP